MNQRLRARQDDSLAIVRATARTARLRYSRLMAVGKGLYAGNSQHRAKSSGLSWATSQQIDDGAASATQFNLRIILENQFNSGYILPLLRFLTAVPSGLSITRLARVLP
jgi:hypothetical protein